MLRIVTTQRVPLSTIEYLGRYPIFLGMKYNSKVEMFNEISLKGHRIKKWLKILNRDDALVAFAVSSNKISFT